MPLFGAEMGHFALYLPQIPLKWAPRVGVNVTLKGVNRGAPWCNSSDNSGRNRAGRRPKR